MHSHQVESTVLDSEKIKVVVITKNHVKITFYLNDKLTSCFPILFGLKLTGISKVEFGSTLNSLRVSKGPPDTSERMNHRSSVLKLKSMLNYLLK